jgi:hypothetical protein
MLPSLRVSSFAEKASDVPSRSREAENCEKKTEAENGRKKLKKGFSFFPS